MTRRAIDRLPSTALHPPPAVIPRDDRTRVMICDDSVVIRSAIAGILTAAAGIDIVARVANGQAALDALQTHAVDVVVLDIEMPVMDGLTALPLLLAAQPGLAIIMASTLTTRGAEISLRALRLGAADTMAKPSANAAAGQARHLGDQFGPELVAKVLGLARLARLTRLTPADRAAHEPPRKPGTPPIHKLRQPAASRPQLLAIGSSTGGPNALFALVQSLPADLAVPVIVTQHMPATFMPILARHIDSLGILPCAEATDGAPLLPGRILLAPGDRHLLVRRRGGQLVAELSDAPPEHFCRPAVDPMLRSASAATAGRVLVTMLTGMGQDGLAGTRQVVDDGGMAVAQDEATSVVWGMPGAIVRAGLVSAVLPLKLLGPHVASLIAPSLIAPTPVLPSPVLPSLVLPSLGPAQLPATPPE